MTLQEAADELGVHYMTAYRYVRTGRLAASKDGATWSVRRADVELLAAERTAAPPPRRGRTKRTLDPAPLVARLAAADEQGAWRLVESALASGADAEAVYLDLLIPALGEVGQQWEAGAMSVADEHTASAIVLRLIGRLGPGFSRPGRKRGTIVLGTVSGDPHGLPTALLSDLLRGRRFAVHDLGGDVPVDAWQQSARDTGRLLAVGVSASSPDQDAIITATVDALRAVVDVPIVLGGTALRDGTHAGRLGADGWAPDARSALELFEGLTAR